MRETKSSERDGALQRLRRTTAVALAAAGALAVAFAGLAARALPGHHTAKVTRVLVPTRRRHVSPPPLVPAQSSVSPAPPASPPVQAQAPPVVVSGGT
jgi:hypothetical protein